MIVVCKVFDRYFFFFFSFLLKQTGEYATDDEETGTTAGGEKSIEVFDLPETEEILSPSELDATKLYQKFREVNSLYTVK